MINYVTMEKLKNAIGEENLPIEISQLDNDSFLKVKETLTRMGIKTKHDGKDAIIQSCYVLRKKGKYYIVHFKHMFLLDGNFKSTKINQEDIDRLVYVTKLLKSWNLVDPIHELSDVKSNVFVLPYSDKNKFILISKYNIGK